MMEVNAMTNSASVPQVGSAPSEHVVPVTLTGVDGDRNRSKDVAARHDETPTILDSPVARFLFSDPRMAWVWLPLRVWLGYEWLTSGWGKFTNPAWIGDGSALKAF